MKVSSLIILFVLLVGIFFSIGYCTRKRPNKVTKKPSMKDKKNTTHKKSETSLETASTNSTPSDSVLPFKVQQMTYDRVKLAYRKKLAIVKGLLKQQDIQTLDIELFIRAVKLEREVEVWARQKGTKPFKLVRTYKFCESSGELGPKRKDGDKQIPEGFYHINRFNPVSKFHLSLGLNYPNRSDKVLGDTTGLGGDIFLHGDCVTVGCIPITDNNIRELYVFAVEAKARGQKKIPVNIFPARLDNAGFDKLKEQYKAQENLVEFWASLKKGYEYFENTKELPTIIFAKSGKYIVKTK
ncbi:L,D-transpeptidase family protein [Microscilla marina]|uniref:Pollen allergen Poa pIX/Phl pVI, C-terminal n=1 Tax=Microscilla marina ATCC 23134 TaxID=313606 RepID=A1ZFX5_MICM2|nr:L,D-transpeptidase family protein [Microscilla marina]EAY30899.1 pollen allergen Poa pIX/Phl pVI, C-terminal [Microscilla marina ATCC 23134]